MNNRFLDKVLLTMTHQKSEKKGIAKPHLFIVDDDLFFAELLLEKLNWEDKYEISYFETGEAMLGGLSENPDVIILDYYLDSLNREASNAQAIIQEMGRLNCHTPVIVLSSQDKINRATETLKAGAIDYITKNKNFATLLERSLTRLFNTKNTGIQMITLKNTIRTHTQRISLALASSVLLFAILEMLL